MKKIKKVNIILILLLISCNFSLKRRCSSRTFRYGYLVTT